MANKRWTVWLAGVLLLLAALAVGLGLWRLSQPDPNGISLYLDCTEGNRNGWTFATEDGPVEPEFFDGFWGGIPAEGKGPVAAERVMEEPGRRNLLMFDYASSGIQVFLDGELLYTDFPNMDNRPDALLEDVEAKNISRFPLYVTLPYDCGGKTLRVVTYGPNWGGTRSVAFPYQVSQFSEAGSLFCAGVPHIAAAMALALLGLFLLVVFLLGTCGGRSDWSLLPLAAYFLLAAVPMVTTDFTAISVGLSYVQPLPAFARLADIDFLMIFLSMKLKARKRWLLLGASLIHMALSLAQALGAPAQAAWAGLAVFVLAFVLTLLSWKEYPIFRWVVICNGVTMGIMAAALAIAPHPWFDPLAIIMSSLLLGSPISFYSALCSVSGMLLTVWTVADSIRNTLDHQRKMQALTENHRLTLENYRTAEEKLHQNAVMRHEWKNQIVSLHLLRQTGDLEGLDRQLEQMEHRLDQLAPRQYSTNPVINTILQNTAARAENLGVKFRAAAPAPPELGIETDDLCSLLLNLLDNALEAASQVPAPAVGEVECDVKVRQGYLAIWCENTYAGHLAVDEAGQFHTTKTDRDSHGFGVAQMQAIAKKYGMLDITYTEDRFTVQTALKLK